MTPDYQNAHRPGFPEYHARAESVEVTDAERIVDLLDGRRLSVPLVWFPRLLRATPDQRAKWELLGDGEGIHWPQVDEDLNVPGLLTGQRSRSA